MTRAARYAYLVLAWLVVVAIVAQVFFIGLGLFAGSQNMGTHRSFGYIVHLLPIPLLLAAALSRAGRRHWQWALALAVVVFIVPILVLMKDTPVIAALHPVGAIVAFWLAVVVALNSLDAIRQAEGLGPDASGSTAG
jgi:mercuric ion transport protein